MKSEENNIIQLPSQVTDEEFNLFMKAFLEPYKGGGYRQEWFIV